MLVSIWGLQGQQCWWHWWELRWPQWYDIYVPRFMKTGKGIEGILTLKGCNGGITGGSDLLSAALKRAQAVCYVYRVPKRSVKAMVFNFVPPPPPSQSCWCIIQVIHSLQSTSTTQCLSPNNIVFFKFYISVRCFSEPHKMYSRTPRWRPLG
jgi:hypothetical protein